jgi:hypothetical protein
MLIAETEIKPDTERLVMSPMNHFLKKTIESESICCSRPNLAAF